jgi:NTE family protein
MKAYAILDGGGVKGAALAGCLKAAEELGIEFAGFGGTSAGSIVALLAVLGYTGDELYHMTVHDLDFTHFLDDDGRDLLRLHRLAQRLQGLRSWQLPIAVPWMLWREHRMLGRLQQDLGLYRADRLQDFLHDKIVNKLPDLRSDRGVTFEDLRRAGRPPLKVVASDLGLGKAVVFSDAGGRERNGPVLDAVRASMSYPFVFRPVLINGRPLVDGGVSSNLPVFLFEHERERDGLPVIAFDLVSPISPQASPSYGLLEFSSALLTTALESTDDLMRQVTRGLYHVCVPVPEGIRAMDFWLSKDRREELWRCGHSQTHTFFRKVVPHWLDAQDEVERLQARYGDPQRVRQVLEVLIQEVTQNTPARQVRAQIMLPTGHGTRRVVYQWGMDGDADQDLELPLDGGCTGRAWVTRTPQFADLEQARRAPAVWHMSVQHHSKVRPDRKAMLCVPIFDLDRATGVSDARQVPILATLSVDSATPLAETGWLKDNFAVQRAIFWADVFSKLLS